MSMDEQGGNDKIDKFIQDAQSNVDRNYKVIEWIPYDRFQDIEQIAKGGYGTIYYAKWVDGSINGWDIKNQQWERKSQFEVALKKFDNIVDINEDFLNEMAILLRTNDKIVSTKIFGITKDLVTHEYMIVLEYFEAIRSKRLHKLDIVHCDFHPGNILKYKLKSNYTYISDFGLNAQSNVDRNYKVIEWIPYDRFQDIEQIAKGGYGTIYYAKWVDGSINGWDIKNQQWERKSQFEVALKKFDNIVDINEDFLNEMAILLRTNDKIVSTKIFGITKDLVTHEYMIVLEYFEGRSLRNYLSNNFKDINLENKLYYLCDLAIRSKRLHKLDIVHCDFHPGNILKYKLKSNYTYISDFGLSKLITENIKNLDPQKNTISGAVDVYSYAFVAYEIITGIPPYHDVSHDKDLAFKICNGFRPKIPFYTPKLITQDARITHRPTFNELKKELNKYWDDYYENNFDNNNEITIQIKEAEEFFKNQTTTDTTTRTPINYKTHPQAIYTGRLLNFSSLPKPKNDENFEKKLEELTKSFYQINASDDDDLDTSNL
ncbi:hypothetical protein Glove_212g154 [Diversispora epigaea]|uniref:Protein kinase domain-containing protein n=1 Tax=Diversispora epigaea TaxID=1348612 RepID=A0A397IRG9_9GLOM|nr:hypothetical protein Glove_212g154 [Diversispora epigaea]